MTTVAQPTLRTRLLTGSSGFRTRTLPPLAALLIVGILWESSGAVLALPLSVAVPSEIIAELTASPQVVWNNVFPTIVGAIAGFLIASTAAIALASVTAMLPRTSGATYTGAVLLQALPLIALSPVLIVIIGTGPEIRIIIAAIAGFFPILVACIQGMRQVGRTADELFTQLNTTRWQRFRYLQVPGALPYVFAGLRVSASAAVLGAILSEWAGANEGLGVAMIYAMSSFNPPALWMYILLSTVMSLTFYILVATVERRVIRWANDRDGSGS